MALEGSTGWNPHPQVDLYLQQGCMRCRLGGTPDCKVHRWEEVLKELRAILLASGLKEEVKWRQPCYTYEGRNVVILSAFKDYCALNFLKGGMIEDRHGFLEKPGEHTQVGRQMRFRSADEVKAREAAIREYLEQAVEIERGGKATPPREAPDLPVPDELLRKFEEMPELRRAFESLTPGRRRAYLMHVSAPKQSKTRAARIEKCIPMILAGKGLYDR
ncbi:YdeI/OmpD-associated family protein [Alicyclobacillus sendaiensis]|uniref:YdeI/OmpD-associated family protein n=1 Tax=Alicyclobacillus sendaiensis TaxID=192387 RepID=UPI0026F40FBD|nr:YdeI/OmpD-associated family protein [Alicyclobacillus sendaiensis]